MIVDTGMMLALSLFYRSPMSCQQVTSGASMFNGVPETLSVSPPAHLMVEWLFTLLWVE